MNAKPNSIAEVLALNSRLRVRSMGEPVMQIVLVRLDRTQHSAPSSQTSSSSGARLADDWSAEFWETLSYAVIWLCGLAGIGLCFG